MPEKSLDDKIDSIVNWIKVQKAPTLEWKLIWIKLEILQTNKTAIDRERRICPQNKQEWKKLRGKHQNRYWISLKYYSATKIANRKTQKLATNKALNLSSKYRSSKTKILVINTYT